MSPASQMDCARDRRRSPSPGVPSAFARPTSRGGSVRAGASLGRAGGKMSKAAGPRSASVSGAAVKSVPIARKGEAAGRQALSAERKPLRNHHVLHNGLHGEACRAEFLGRRSAGGSLEDQWKAAISMSDAALPVADMLQQGFGEQRILGNLENRSARETEVPHLGNPAQTRAEPAVAIQRWWRSTQRARSCQRRHPFLDEAPHSCENLPQPLHSSSFSLVTALAPQVSHQRQAEAGQQFDADDGAGAGEHDNAGCSFQPLSRRPYCPSRYEDAAPAQQPGGSERVSQMKYRLRSLQLRGHFDDQADAVAKAEPVSPGSAPSRSSQPSEPSQPAPHIAASSGLTAVASRPSQPKDKLASILNFLDEVEESSRADASSMVSSARSSRGMPEEITNGGRLLGLGLGPVSRGTGCPPSGLTLDAAGAQARLSLLELEVRDKKKSIDTLKKALSDARDHEKHSVQSVTKELEDKLQKQKAHYEAGLERHLKLVDRLLNDKTELTKRCELLAEELKAMERRFQMKLEERDEHASKELTRNKHNWMAAEKMRREAWEKDKVKEIKEITVKGLQPEVERILAERKQEKQRLEDKHREALDALRTELQSKAQEQLRDLRETLLKEQERALDHERDNHRRKLREEFDRFSEQLQDERAKCASDLLGERRRYEQQMQQGMQGTEERLRDAVAAERTSWELKLQEARQAAADAQEHHRVELTALAERLRTEMAKAQQEQSTQAREELACREAALREELAAERDKQLDVLMERLSREHVEQQRASKEAAAAEVARARAEADENQHQLSRQLEEARAQVSTLEAQRECAQETVQSLKERHEVELGHIAELEARLRDLQSNKDTLRREAEETAERQKCELRRAVEAKDKELQDKGQEEELLKSQFVEQQAAAEEKLRQARNHEEEVISGLERRVKRTLQTKEEAMAELRTRCVAAENKVREFEYLLARQREELLSGITKDLRS